MLFIGGGYIAFEFAHVAARCGVEVTIVDVASKVLHNFDQDIVQHLMEATKALGIEIVTGAEVTEVVKNKEGYTVIAQQNGKSVRYKASLVINASGRIPAIQGLNLKKGNVKLSKNGVEVNEFLQSVSNPVVYASGDVTATNGLPLTPMASREAKVVVTNILRGNQEKPDYSVMPTVVFTIPPLATVGLTEKQAKKGKLNFRAKHESVPEWFSAKHRNAPQYAYKVLIENESEKILGAHLVGPNAGEMINLFALAIKTGCTVSQLKSIPFTFPTSGADINSMV
jgi:glutathione reductase (NADPH)